MLGDMIRKYRKLNQLSQEDLAEKLGVSRQSISLWENNQTQPTIENIIVLARLFNISTDDLLATNIAEEEPCLDTPGYDSLTEAGLPISEVNPQRTQQPQRKKILDKKITLLIVISAIVAIIGVALFLVLSKVLKPTAEDIYGKISPSVVEIVGQSFSSTSTGTGFFYDENGTIVTNYHVIENCFSAEITVASGEKYQVNSVLGYDTERDIAILSTSCKKSIPLTIRTTPVKTGEEVYALGSSLGLTGTLSNGIVSAVQREVESNVYIQTTAPISQGNSGGPLVDAKGKVVGIVCASFIDGQNLNLAIPIAALNKVSLNKNFSLDTFFHQTSGDVELLSNYRFMYYADSSSYVLLFQLSNKNNIPLSAPGTVKIRIVNDDNLTVYSNTHNYSQANFEEWIYNDTEEMYLAAIYISPQNITTGSTDYGTVYFEVTGETYSFEECSIITFDLPTTTNPTPSTPPKGGTTQQPTTQPTKNTCLKSFCDNEVSENGTYCTAHRCQTTGCSYSKEADAKYCSVCSCNTIGCINQKIANGYYCTEHTCAATGCVLGKVKSSNYCSAHQSLASQGGTTQQPPTQQATCKQSSCNNVVNHQGEYCSAHKCATSSCTYNKETNADYCSICLCGKTGCKNSKIANGYYCTDHTCKASGCTTEKQYSSDYCITHKCWSCDNIKITNGSYCIDHTCSKSGCNDDKQYGSEYCMSHTCMAGLCKKETLGNGNYCEEHTCIVPGCDKQKLLDDYCYSHSS